MLIKRHTIASLRRKKDQREPIVALTAYDYAMAMAVDQSGVDLILVGDSLGPVVLGHPNTLSVTMDEMIHHARAVARGTHRAFVVADMPFMADASLDEAVRNGGRFLKEAMVQAIKLEGGHPPQLEAIRSLVAHGVPVVAHLGFTPQHLHQLGGFKIQGKTPEAAEALMAQALAVEAAGASMLVLELVPDEVARRVTEALSIPTIGIGAGEGCDGQIQVLHDLVGLHVDHLPKHARRYANLHESLTRAIAAYAEDVRSGRFLSTGPSYAAEKPATTSIDSQEGIV
ncbi:MAG TPA: 3-methyl-2-oxobutanoate hydroxymethyltransferase [Pantanalinema sp.]